MVLSDTARYLKALSSLTRVMLPASNGCLRRFWATRMEIPALSAASREPSPFGLDSTSFSSFVRSASSARRALFCDGMFSSGSVSRTLAGERVSIRRGLLDSAPYQTFQMFWRPLPARSLAPMKDGMRMSVGFLDSETPPAMATSRSTSRLPGFVTSSLAFVRTTLIVHEPP